MAPTAARRAKPVQRSSSQGLQGNPDACHPRRGSAWRDDHYGAPAEAQRSGFGGERRHSGGNELCRLRRSERSATCADEAGGNARLVSALYVQPTAAMGPPYWGAGVEGAGGAFDVNLCEASFLKRREAPFLREEMGAPAASEAPGALPIKIQRSHLQKSGAFPGVPRQITAGASPRPTVHGNFRASRAFTRRATTGRPYGRRAESSRPTGQRLRGQAGG